MWEGLLAWEHSPDTTSRKGDAAERSTWWGGGGRDGDEAALPPALVRELRGLVASIQERGLRRAAR